MVFVGGLFEIERTGSEAVEEWSFEGTKAVIREERIFELFSINLFFCYDRISDSRKLESYSAWCRYLERCPKPS